MFKYISSILGYDVVENSTNLNRLIAFVYSQENIKTWIANRKKATVTFPDISEMCSSVS